MEQIKPIGTEATGQINDSCEEIVELVNGLSKNDVQQLGRGENRKTVVLNDRMVNFKSRTITVVGTKIELTLKDSRWECRIRLRHALDENVKAEEDGIIVRFASDWQLSDLEMIDIEGENWSITINESLHKSQIEDDRRCESSNVTNIELLEVLNQTVEHIRMTLSGEQSHGLNDIPNDLPKRTLEPVRRKGFRMPANVRRFVSMFVKKKSS